MPNNDIKISADIQLNTSSLDRSLDQLKGRISSTLNKVTSSGAEKGFENIVSKTQEAVVQTENYETKLKSLQAQLQTAIAEAHKGNAVFGASDQYKNAISSVAEYQRKIEELQTALAENARNASLPQAIQMPSMSVEQIAQAEQQISQYQAKIQELEATMTSMETRGTAFPTLSQGIKEAEVELSATATQALLLQQNLEAVSGTAPTTGNTVQQSMQKVSQSVTQGAQQVQQAKQTMSQPTDMQNMVQSVNSLTAAVNNLIKSLQGASSGFSNMRTSASNVGKSASSSLAPLGKTIKGAFGNTGKFASLVGGKLQGAFNKVKNSAEEAFSPKRIKHGLTTLLKYTFGVRSLFFLFRKLRKAVKEGIENLVQYESKTGSASKGVKSTNQAISSLRTSLLYLKNAWAAAFAPIINTVMPLLTNLIDGIAGAANYIAKFVGALTGQKVVLNAVKTSAGDYAKSLDKSSDNADKAAKSQKKLNDRLAQFDDLNVLGKDDDNDSGNNSDNNNGFTPDPKNMFKIVDTGSADSLVEMLKKAWETADFTKIGELLKNKIIGALDYVLEHMSDIENFLTKIASSIGTFFAGLLSDPNLFIKIGAVAGGLFNAVQKAFSTFLDKVEKIPLGKNLASMVGKLLTTINFKLAGENINRALKTLLNNVKDFFDNTKSEDVSKAIIDFFEGLDIGGLVLTAKDAILSLKGLVINVGAELLVKASDDVGQKLWDAVTKGVESQVGDKKVVLKTDIDPTISNSNALAALVDTALTKVGETVIGRFTKTVQNIGKLMGKEISKDEVLQGAISAWDKVTSAFGVLTGTLKMLKDDFTLGCQAIGNGFVWLTDKVADAIGAINGFVIGLGNTIAGFFTNVYNWGVKIGQGIVQLGINIGNAIKTVVKFFTETIPNAVTVFKDGLSQRWESIKSGVTDTWNNIKSTIIGAVENFKVSVETKINTFKSNIIGAWETLKSDTIQKFTDLKNKAVEIFNGIKDAIKTPVNGIISIVESLVNKVISAINSVADKLNSLPSLQFKNPFNGQDYKLGFNIPKLSKVSIPRLAQGAVIPPNKEFMAMLGDQSHGTNIEAPLDTIKQAVAEVVGNNGSAEMIQLLQQLITVVENKNLTIGDKEIGRANARFNKQQSIVRGTSF